MYIFFSLLRFFFSLFRMRELLLALSFQTVTTGCHNHAMKRFLVEALPGRSASTFIELLIGALLTQAGCRGFCL